MRETCNLLVGRFSTVSVVCPGLNFCHSDKNEQQNTYFISISRMNLFLEEYSMCVTVYEELHKGVCVRLFVCLFVCLFVFSYFFAVTAVLLVQFTFKCQKA